MSVHICRHCGVRFSPHHHANEKYCSAECRKKGPADRRPGGRFLILSRGANSLAGTGADHCEQD